MRMKRHYLIRPENFVVFPLRVCNKKLPVTHICPANLDTLSLFIRYFLKEMTTRLISVTMTFRLTASKPVGFVEFYIDGLATLMKNHRKIFNVVFFWSIVGVQYYMLQAYNIVIHHFRNLFIWLHHVWFAAWGLSCPAACGILVPNHGSNLHCKTAP